MRDDDSFAIDVDAITSQGTDDRFIRQAVKTVAAHPLVEERARQGRELGHSRQAVVKCGVETGDLQQARPGASDCGDSGQTVGLVQWRKWYQATQPVLDRCGHHQGVITVRPSVDDAMAHRNQWCSRHLPVNRVQNQAQRRVVVRNVCVLFDQRRAVNIDGAKVSICQADAVDRS